MRRKLFGVALIAGLALVLGVGLLGSHNAGAQEDRDREQDMIDAYRAAGLSQEHAKVFVWLLLDLTDTITEHHDKQGWALLSAMEELRTGDIQDGDNPNMFRGPSLADLQAQIAGLESELARLSNLPVAQCMP